MTTTLKLTLIAAVCLVDAPLRVSAQHRDSRPAAPAVAQREMPSWMRRGLPGPGHAALEPLVGAWRVHKSIYATMGRRSDEPPLVSDDIIARREWVAGGRYVQDTTEGTVAGMPYWRRGWLGYSNMDRRYEWVTIDAVNTTMMIYLGAPGSGQRTPISMSGAFTDQGVAGERSVGKRVGQRTVIRIENKDRHVIELYFTPPGGKEALADRSVYTRAPQSGTSQRQSRAQYQLGTAR
jgi:hypothetical protein